MEFRNRLICRLYDAAKTADDQKLAVDLLKELERKYSCTEDEFYEALIYFEDLKYIKSYATKYRITGLGMEYVEREIKKTVPNPQAESNRKQTTNNWLAFLALVLTAYGVWRTYFSDSPNMFTPKSDEATTPAVSATAALIPFHDMDAAVWFPDPQQFNPNYIPEAMISELGTESDPGDSYFRIYRHPSDCQSNNVRGVLVQVIFFEDTAGSSAYFQDAFESVRVTDAEITNTVGETSYFRKYVQADGHCSSETSEIYSLLFQRNNAIGIAKAWIVPSSMDRENVHKWLNQIATDLDQKFLESVEG